MKTIFILWLITASSSTPVGLYKTEGSCWDAQALLDRKEAMCVMTDKVLFLELTK